MLKNVTTYTPTEKKIGIWQDGRPIYRQRVKLPNQTSANSVVALDLTTVISDINEVVTMPFGYATYSNGQNSRSVLSSFNYGSGENWQCAGFVVWGNILFFSDNNLGYPFVDIYAYVSYTKTSDPATVSV